MQASPGYAPTRSGRITVVQLYCNTAELGAPMEEQMRHEYHVSVQRRGLIALPADLRKRHHLDEPGAQVRVVERDDGVIEMHPLAAVPADQKWFWTDRWQQMEGEAQADIAAGRVAAFEDVEEFLADLDA